MTKPTITTGDKMQFSIPITVKKAEGAERPKVFVTAIAQKKMNALIDLCPKEVAWHGFVRKDGTTYTIYDIVVFPQEVTAAQAYSNDAEYGAWLSEIPDEDYNNLRFHGHSHVNMTTSPSATDTAYQEDVVKLIKDYYVFAIYNKQGKFNVWVYDKEANWYYETADIDYEVEVPTIYEWAQENIDKYVKEHKPTTTYANVGSYGQQSFGAGYNTTGNIYGKPVINSTDNDVESKYWDYLESQGYIGRSNL